MTYIAYELYCTNPETLTQDALWNTRLPKNESLEYRRNWSQSMGGIENILNAFLAPSQYEDRLTRYGDSHVKDKAVLRSS